MKKLKPVKAHIELEFQCPKCDALWPATVEETKFPGGRLCTCGYPMKFERIERVEISIGYNKKKPVQKTQPQQTQPQSGTINTEEIVQGMVGLGWKKTEAKKRVEALCSQKEYSDSNELLQEALSC